MHHLKGLHTKPESQLYAKDTTQVYAAIAISQLLEIMYINDMPSCPSYYFHQDSFLVSLVVVVVQLESYHDFPLQDT